MPPMNDRLADLGDDVPAWARDHNATDDIEMGYVSKSTKKSSDDFDWQVESEEEPASSKEKEDKSAMDAFFRDVDSIKKDIEMIEKVTKRIAEINEESVLSVSEAREKELSQEMQPLISATNARAKKTKNLLSVLKDENKGLKKKLNVSDMRVRENLCNTLTRKFIDEMKLYQSAQQKFKADIKKKAERQILTVKEDATPEEIDQIMKSDGGREGLYQQTFLAGGVNDNIKQAYTKVAGKYQDVLALEQSVAELHQMFLDFALLTEQQGELIDQIEFNVKSAADYVEEANVDVYHAIESSKSIRKKQCCVILIAIIIAIVLLFSLKIIP